jgi:protein ImuB
MAALPHPVWSAGPLPKDESAAEGRRPNALWLALQVFDPPPEPAALASLADWAESLTPNVVLRPDEGLLLEVGGSLRYFSGLSVIRERLTAELECRGWAYRLTAAPTPLAAEWLVRCKHTELIERGTLAGALGGLPLAATAWPDSVQRMLGQMGVRSIADCLRLPRAGFARRVGRAWLDELDRALGKKPDLRAAYRAPQTIYRAVELAFETRDRAVLAEALSGMVVSLERELRRRQRQVREIELEVGHLRREATRTRMRFVDPVHERERVLKPLLERIERLRLSEPAIALSLQTGSLLPFAPDRLELVPGHPSAGATQPEFALIEVLRGRFGARRVYGIGWVAEHRPERAWCRWIERPVPVAKDEPACPSHGRPLWLLPEPERRGKSRKRGQSPFSLKKGSDPGSCFFPERIESGWWDGQDVRRDYHVVIGSMGEKLWLYRDCRTHEWYLHGIFG